MNLPLTYIWQPARVSSTYLMVVLHGRGDSAEGFLGLQEALNISSINYLLLNAPNPYYSGFAWYDLPPNQLPGVLNSRRLLTHVFEETPKAGFPPEKTFLFGFSQGCLLTLEFGSRYPKRLAGYIGISGYCYDPQAILNELSPEANYGDWLITHGTDDEILSIEETRRQMHMLNESGFRIDYREFRKTHTLDMRKELPQIREWLLTRVVG